MFKIIDQKNIIVYPHRYKTTKGAIKDIEKEDPIVQKNLAVLNERFLIKVTE